jgi:hypothetical protein
VKSDPRYQTAAGLRMALEERLNRQAREKGLDVLRLRRKRGDWNDIMPGVRC